MTEKPTLAEFLIRIPRHLQHRQNNDAVNLLWHGYLAGLMEWGLLAPDDYHQLREQLREIGEDERREIFLGLDGPGQ
jgi:hypothetical protein